MIVGICGLLRRGCWGGLLLELGRLMIGDFAIASGELLLDSTCGSKADVGICSFRFQEVELFA